MEEEGFRLALGFNCLTMRYFLFLLLSFFLLGTCKSTRIDDVFTFYGFKDLREEQISWGKEKICWAIDSIYQLNKIEEGCFQSLISSEENRNFGFEIRTQPKQKEFSYAPIFCFYFDKNFVLKDLTIELEPLY